MESVGSPCQKGAFSGRALAEVQIYMAVMRGGSAAGTPPERQAEGKTNAIVPLAADCGVAGQPKQMPELHPDLGHNNRRRTFGVMHAADNVIEAHTDSESGERIDGFALTEVIMSDQTYRESAVVLSSL